MPNTTAEQVPAKIARDLDADLAICEAATPGPYRITPCGCSFSSCKQVFVNVTHSDGRFDPNDALFLAEARIGWPYAIHRAQEAEREADKLREENAMLLEQLQQHRSRHHSDSHCYD